MEKANILTYLRFTRLPRSSRWGKKKRKKRKGTSSKTPLHLSSTALVGCFIPVRIVATNKFLDAIDKYLDCNVNCGRFTF